MTSGFNNMMGFIGIVEDIYDPMKMGRLKVRAFGIHSSEKSDTPTEDLPWAFMIDGTYGSFNVPKVNSWVFGMFMDGAEAQHPIILGVMNGMITEMPDFDCATGYGVPTDQTQACDAYAPTISALARGEHLERTHLPVTNASMGERIDVAETGNPEIDEDEEIKESRKWTMPGSSYNSEYPFNRVLETSSGHLIEYDDTPGGERINVRHSSGTFIEMDSAGNIKIMADTDIYVVSEGNMSTYIKGTNNVTVEGDTNVYSKGDTNIQSDGDLNISCHADMNMNIAGGLAINTGAGIDVKGSRVSIESYSSYLDLWSAKDLRCEAKGSMSLKSEARGYFEGSKVDILGTDGVVSISGEGTTRIDLGADNALDPDPSRISKKPPKVKPKTRNNKSQSIDFGIFSDDDTSLV